MSRTDREDAVARALDILPPGDEARSDPRLLRDPDLAEEARLTREAAADLWLAVSPLRAAPSDVLHSVMAKVSATPSSARRGRRFVPWLAASGWAAAAAVAIVLWPRGAETISAPDKEVTARQGISPQREEAVTGESSSGKQAPDDRQLRKELMKLRGSLARINSEALLTAPRVMSLSSPGSVQRTPEEARERVWAVLTGALRSALEAESGAPGDPAALVIERGWLPEGVTAPEDGGVIRHRNFPEESWQELGLMKSDEGSYFDPVKNLVWTQDPEGRGFIGRKATEQDNLTVYKQADSTAAIAKNQPRTQPEGFVIEDPVTNKAQVVIDQVPAPAEGREQLVMWTDSSGSQGSMTVASSKGAVALNAASARNGVTAPMYFQSGTSNFGLMQGTMVFSIPNSGGVRSFQLVESSIIPDGHPPRVIVKSGP
jgi:hypothetical protein